MNDCKKSKMLFDEAFFGELTGRDKEFLDSHLENCPKCRTQLDQNSSLLSGITVNNEQEPHPDFWENYTANLHQRMMAEGHIQKNEPAKQHSKIKELKEKLSNLLTVPSFPTWALQSAAAAVFVVIGIFIGSRFFAPGPLPVPTPAPTPNNGAILAAGPATGQNAIQRTANFLDRSRVILLAIENFDPETESTQAINIPFQQEISRNLLKEAASLKQDLSGPRRRRLKELIAELEIILLQIANIDPGSEMETIQLVKGGQYIRGMLFKIRINDLRRSTYKTKKKELI